MPISLVVPIRNEEESLPALVASIQSQTRPPDEVIMVDGGSADQTVALANQLTSRDPRFRLIEAGHATPGRGRNVGIAAASHDWIALTDAGIRLESNWLQGLIEVLEHDPSLDVVYGNYEPIVVSPFAAAAALAYAPPKRERPGGRMRGPSIASALIRRHAWQAAGGFPDLRAAEDLIFMERLESCGSRIGWAPTATVWWQLSPSLAHMFKRFVLYSRHNVWARRQRDWHYGVLRHYLLALPLLVLAMGGRPEWLGILFLAAMARIGKSIWSRREGRCIAWALNPSQFARVGIILAAIDLATFVGWAQAARGGQSPTGPVLCLPRDQRQG